MILSKKFENDYSERARRSAKSRVLEFRLKLDHELFVKSPVVKQVSQYFSQLRRSVEMMAKWDMSPNDRSTLLNVLNDAERALIQTGPGHVGQGSELAD